MQTFFWVLGVVLIATPVLLTFFSIFLMLTQRAVEPDIYEDDSGNEDIDQMAKRHYKSNT